VSTARVPSAAEHHLTDNLAVSARRCPPRNGSANTINARTQVALEFMLPETQHDRSLLSQGASRLLIFETVSYDFFPPKRWVRFRLMVANWTTMPKASINEDCDLRFAKEEIRSPRHTRVAHTPTPQAGCS
jgi:hypothetical protein